MNEEIHVQQFNHIMDPIELIIGPINYRRLTQNSKELMCKCVDVVNSCYKFKENWIYLNFVLCRILICYIVNT